MADLLNRGMRMLGVVHETSCSRSVAITRPSGGTGTASATIGSTPFRTEDIANGTSKIVRSDRDYFIRAASYKINNVAVTPKRGDKFVDSVDGKTYECQPIVDGEPAWRFSDPDGEVYRIHCVKVA
jgi:hypothetical protein